MNPMAKSGRDWIQFLLDRALWIILLVIFVFFGIRASGFLSGTNLVNILLHSTVLGILVIGQTICLLSKNFDLSAEGTLSLTTVMAAWMMNNTHLNTLFAIPLMIIVGGLAGLINGLLITRLRMNNFIVTLAMQLFLRGIASLISGGIQINVKQSPFNWLGVGMLGPIPVAIIFTPLLFIAVHYYLKRSKFGRQLYAVGSNPEAARASGFNPARTVTIAYVLSGVLAGIAGWMLLGRVQVSYSLLGSGFTLETVAASVIGGISLLGGLGTVGGAFAGVMLLSLVDDGLNLMSVNSYWVNGIRGLFILVALVIDAQKVRYQPKRKIQQIQTQTPSEGQGTT
jgi:ribose/xylose/arabinose/galactoside ABC-type transport system permease subunit